MSIASCERGTASVELIVMLPVFIVLFAGVTHIYNLGLAGQAAQSKARACGYHYGMSGCTKEAADHSICAGLKVGKAGAVAGGSEDTKDAEKSILDELTKWPVFGDIVAMLFGEGSSATAEQVAKATVGAEDSKLSGRFYMVCNTESKSWSDRLKELLCDAGSKFGGAVIPGCN